MATPIKQYHVTEIMMLEIVGAALKRKGKIPKRAKLIRMWYCEDGRYYVIEAENLDSELGIPSKF